MHFYATKGDLVPVLEKIESTDALTYVRYGHYSEPEFSRFDSALDIPTLGVASSEAAVSCESFVVLPRTTKLVPREIRLNGGIVRYAVDQLLNPGSITFQSGGRHSSGVILHGRVATASTTAESRRLLGRFERVFKKSFAKVAAFYVGPEALDLLERGARLTMALQSPPAYDLKRPNKSVQTRLTSQPV